MFAAGLDDVAVAIAKFQRWASLGEADRKLALWFDRVDGDQVVFAAVDGFEMKGTVPVPRAVLDRVGAACSTSNYQHELIVDQNFAVAVLDRVKAQRAATTPVVPAAPAAATPSPLPVPAALPTWVALSLAEPLDITTLVDRARALGVNAEASRFGVSFPGGFLARIEASPWPERIVDRALTLDSIAFGSVTLHISGGTNEVERTTHMDPAFDRRVASSPLQMLGLPKTDAPSESAASRKMTRLTELVCQLAPLATVVVLPFANHTVFAAPEFAQRAATHLATHGYAFPLWRFLTVHADIPVETIASTGMWPFGLPDVGIAGTPEQRADHATAVGELHREMVAEGWWPAHGARFQTSVGELVIERMWDVLWLALGDRHHAAARARFASIAQMRRILGSSVHHHRPSATAGQPSIEHFLRRGATSMAITNGLSDAPQRGGTDEGENSHVELVISSQDLGPWADRYLGLAAATIAGHDGSRPIYPFDRIAFGTPTPGVAGAILWPMGDLRPLQPGDPHVRLWELLPITASELAAFRADPVAQRDWIATRTAAADFPAISARWPTR